MKAKQRVIPAVCTVAGGSFPTLLEIAHRQLQKGGGIGVVGDKATLQVPVDVLRVLVSDENMIKGITRLTLSYSKGGNS